MSDQIPDSVIAYLAKAALNGVMDDPMYWDFGTDQRERDKVFRAIRSGLAAVEEVGRWRLVPREPSAAMFAVVEDEIFGKEAARQALREVWDAAPSALLPVPEDHKYDR